MKQQKNILAIKTFIFLIAVWLIFIYLSGLFFLNLKLVFHIKDNGLFDLLFLNRDLDGIKGSRDPFYWVTIFEGITFFILFHVFYCFYYKPKVARLFEK